MANWSKRRTQTFKSSKNRITRTHNSSGKSTYSSSKKVGNTRTTTSISNGKVRIYTTETHPTLGTKRTTWSPNKIPKTKKPRARKAGRRKSYSSSSGSNYQHDWTQYKNREPSPFWDWFWGVSWWWWVAAIALLVMGSAWFIWLIFFSAFLKFEVDLFK